jgi:hypothetical protein
MKGLPTLIRLARRRADEQRVALAEAERQALLAAGALDAHDRTTSRETEGARGKAEDMALWSDWSRVAAGQRRRLALAAELLRAQEDRLRAALREDFAETKRLEIALEAAGRAAARQAARRAERAAEDAELRRPRAT